eukprot:m.86493 g.86493  ORF g.86493 m.86493 type:complete len:1260 (-) comp25975_c0_seq1:66-3845(-)
MEAEKKPKKKRTVKLKRADNTGDLKSVDDVPATSSTANRKRRKTDKETTDSRFVAKEDMQTDSTFIPRSKKELYALPTHGEVRELEQTQYLFKSNLFKLQMDEMLAEVRVNKDKQTGLEQALHHLKTVVEKMADTEEKEMDVSETINGVHIPLPESICVGKIKFKFSKPSNVAVVGSYLLQTSTKPRLNVDVALEMPNDLFQPKDHLNHRYTCKRAFYLATVAAKLKKDKILGDVSFSHAEGNILRPILTIKPNLSKWEKSTKFCIRVFPTIAEDVFKLSKLKPDRNSLRTKTGKHLLPELFGDVDEEGGECATPYYNSTILSDALMELHLQELDKYSDCANFVDAVRLLKVWLLQRGMRGDAFGVFNGFCASMLLCHLMDTRVVFHESSSFQMFRAAMQCLALNEWDVKGCQVGVAKATSIEGLAAFHTAFDVVFIEPSGNLNLLANMTSSQYVHLKHEANNALQMLEDPAVDGFECLFMQKVDFDVAFDMIVVCNSVSHTLMKNYYSHFLSRGGDWEAFALKFLPELLRRGLKDRASIVTALPRQSQTWGVTTKASALTEDRTIRIGIMLVDAHIDRTIDMGPPADDAAEASKFRNFWGAKSELRRFASGGINEAVVWVTEEPTCANPLQLTQTIVRYLLNRHAKLKASNVHTTADLLLEPLQRPRTLGPRESERASRVLGQRLGEVLKKLRDDRDALPLGISSLQGVSASFRFSSPFSCDYVHQEGTGLSAAGTSKGWPSPLVPQDVLLQFETSTKWPADLSAIQNVKAAFYLKIAALLSSKHDYITIPTRHHVDILDKPFAYRLVIFVPTELTLAKQSRENIASSLAENGDDATMKATLAAYDGMVAEMERFYVRLPRHTRFVQSTRVQHHSYSLAMRLANRWVSAHMHSADLQEEAIELIVASVYTSPSPYSAPTSGVIGFLRFLHVLGYHDWETSPLIVADGNEDKTSLSSSSSTTTTTPTTTTTATPDDATASILADKFLKDRASFPFLTISGPGDRERSLWTAQAPSKPIAIRLIKLAQASVKTLRKSISELGDVEAEGHDERMIFRTPLDTFDVVLHLKPLAVATVWQKLGEDAKKHVSNDLKYKNLTLHLVSKKDSAAPRVGFNAAESLLRDLRKAYGHVATFYYDEHGGTSVGVVWERAAVVAHPFKAKFSREARLVTGQAEDGVQIKLNVDAIIEDLQQIGRGVISHAEIKSSPTSTTTTSETPPTTTTTTSKAHDDTVAATNTGSKVAEKKTKKKSKKVKKISVDK